MKAENRSKLSELIEKINWLHKNLVRTKQENINQLEADLLLSYLDDLRSLVMTIKSEQHTHLAIDFNEEMVDKAAARILTDLVNGEEEGIDVAVDEHPIGVDAVQLNGKTNIGGFQNGLQSPSINESFSKPDKLEAKTRSERIRFLKQVLSLNERFGFIQHLFDRDEAELNTFVQKLDACTTFQEGDHLLQNELKPGLKDAIQLDFFNRLVILFEGCFI